MGGVKLNAKTEEIHEDDLDELVSDLFSFLFRTFMVFAGWQGEGRT